MQGAFSAYRKSALLEVGGWKNVVGEDIVLTWDLLNKGYETYHNTDAVALTETPDSYRQFFQQRKRWSRGMIEAFRSNWRLLFKAKNSTIFIWYNLLFPYIDFVFAFIFIPSVLAALFSNFHLLASDKTLLIIPLTLFFTSILYFVQKRTFKKIGLEMSKNIIGMLFYVIFFQIIQTPATLSGYFSEIFKLKKTWGTKKSKLISVVALFLISSGAFSQSSKVSANAQTITDSDKNSASKIWIQYSKEINNFLLNAKSGRVYVADKEELESMPFIGIGASGNIKRDISFDVSMNQVIGSYAPFLYNGIIKVDAIPRFHGEILFSRNIVETMNSLDNEVSFVSNGLTLDYSIVKDKLILVGGYLNQQFTDDNKREVYIGKLVWVVADLFAVNSMNKLMRINRRSQNYFSPGKFDTHTLGIHKYFAVLSDNFLLRPELGLGLQRVDSQHKDFYFGKLLFRGNLSPKFSLKISAMYSTAISQYGEYGLFMGNFSLGYKF